MKRIALFGLLAMSAGLISASEFKPLTGQYVITGPSLQDAPPDARRDRVVFFLEGDAARDVYRGMTAEAKPQVCAPDDAVVKSAGGMECMFDASDDTYACWISMRFDSGEAVHTDVPC
jgi:hypothetical protein